MTTTVIESIGVLSLAKILGVMGLLWGIIVALTWLVTGLFGLGLPGFPELIATVVGGTLGGVIGGAITAIIYNAAASLLGGIAVDLA